MIERTGRFIFRTPARPLDQINAQADIDLWVNDEAFMEAIYIASPVLYEECMRYKNQILPREKEIAKLSASLLKYHLRMSSRCTPFGLFSACSVGRWSKEAESNIIFSRDKQLIRHTRLDMDYLCALAQHLEKIPVIREQLIFYPNTSLYKISDEWRFVEYHYAGGKRQHQISAALKSDYLDLVLQSSMAGMPYQEICGLLTNEEITLHEAAAFVDELIECHLLISELEPAITGNGFLTHILHTLERLKGEEVSKVVTALWKVNELLMLADSSEKKNGVNIYYEIAELIKTLGVPFEKGRLFQTDTFRSTHEAFLDEQVGQNLDEAVALASMLTPQVENENMQQFRKRFYERYEEKEVPLLEVLDTETGIGYLQNHSSDITPLVDKLYVPNKKSTENSIRWGMMGKFLSGKLEAALKNHSDEIQITEKDLDYLRKTYNLDEQREMMPPSFSCMFRLVSKISEPAQYESPSILFENAGGSSAANLLARFAHTDPEIENQIMEITNLEQGKNPDVIITEIIHLPESRVGNILLHPRFRSYEIPYLAASSCARDKQLPLQDLYISVKNGQVILRSKKLNKRIIPRLSSAHNYSFNAQPVYQFLCDLQTQGLKQGVGFSWGGLELIHSYLPRVVYKNIILEPARWLLPKKQYDHLLPQKDKERIAGLKSYLKFHKMPRYLLLADGDNELAIDTESEQHIAMFLETIKGRSGIQLKELLFTPEGLVTDNTGKSFNAQFIASYIRTTPAYNPLNIAKEKNDASIPLRNFLPGSEWLYFKLYCGKKTADKILEQTISPLVNKFKGENLIDRWFFIRYADPEFHLRIRFHVPDINNLAAIIFEFNKVVASLEKDNLVWKCQMDTYSRELERYGYNKIIEAEGIFHFDSEAVLQFFHLTSGDDREEIRWTWAMRNIDQMLDDFGYCLEKKLRLLNALKQSFANEFAVDKRVHRQLGDLYRTHKARIESMLNQNTEDRSEFEALFTILQERSIKWQQVINSLKGSKEGASPLYLNDLLSSFAHMAMNRICTSRARLQEMVVYDFLYRYYDSLQARLKKKESDKPWKETKERSFTAEPAD